MATSPETRPAAPGPEHPAGHAKVAVVYTRPETVFEDLLERELSAPLESLALARLALLYAATGREQEARDAIGRAVELFPRTSISYEKTGNPFKDPSITEQRSEIWRRLGMPE